MFEEKVPHEQRFGPWNQISLLEEKAIVVVWLMQFCITLACEEVTVLSTAFELVHSTRKAALRSLSRIHGCHLYIQRTSLAPRCYLCMVPRLIYPTLPAIPKKERGAVLPTTINGLQLKSRSRFDVFYFIRNQFKSIHPPLFVSREGNWGGIGHVSTVKLHLERILETPLISSSNKTWLYLNTIFHCRGRHTMASLYDTTKFTRMKFYCTEWSGSRTWNASSVVPFVDFALS